MGVVYPGERNHQRLSAFYIWSLFCILSFPLRFFFGYHLRVIVMRSISMLGMIIGQSGFLGPQAFFLHRNGMMKALEVQYWRYYYPVLFSSRLPLRICRRGKEHG